MKKDGVSYIFTEYYLIPNNLLLLLLLLLILLLSFLLFVVVVVVFRVRIHLLIQRISEDKRCRTGILPLVKSSEILWFRVYVPRICLFTGVITTGNPQILE